MGAQRAIAELGRLEEETRQRIADRAVAAPLARRDAQAVDHAAHVGDGGREL